MKIFSKWSAAVVLLSGSAYAQVPSTNDTSDNFSNTGMGTDALIHIKPDSTPAGYGNTAAGFDALGANKVGFLNAAFGSEALSSNTGIVNTAVGAGALGSNTTGSMNTAIGYETFNDSTTGSGNIALGYSAGFNVGTGSYNIEIGNEGEIGDGVEESSGVIRIGTAGTQTKTYIAGIENSTITGKEVIITAGGQLGVKASAERYKTAIEPMGTNSEKLEQLRPVSFHLKSDTQREVQYGLIAEEVVKVYPELVTRDEKGQIDGVRYDELAPMLLNEMQREHATVAAQAAEIRDLKAQAVAQADQLKSTQRQVAELKNLKQELRAALLQLQSKDPLVAQR